VGDDAGGRYDYAMASTLTRPANTLAKNHDQQFTWRGGINYLFDNGISPYFSYSQSLSRFPDRRGMANPSMLPTANSMKPG
jgi:outer membrane receptor protein involved in Fe transport